MPCLVGLLGLLVYWSVCRFPSAAVSGKCTSLLNSSSILTLKHLSELTQLYVFWLNSMRSIYFVPAEWNDFMQYKIWIFGMACTTKFYFESCLHMESHPRLTCANSWILYLLIFVADVCRVVHSGKNMPLVFKHSLQVKFEIKAYRIIVH